MYSKYETPLMKASLFYYDSVYSQETSKQVLDILLKYGFFPPLKIYAASMTKNNYISADEDTGDLFVRSYSEKDILEIDMSSGDSRKVHEYWKANWGLTFLKNSHRTIKQPKTIPWNIFSLYSTYGLLKESEFYENYFNCIFDLIAALKPFFAAVDDVDNRVRLMSKEEHFVPDRIQQIYWGNYWGKNFCEKYGIDETEDIPTQNVRKIGDGFWFSLTDSAFEFNATECKIKRKIIRDRFL
ncbi:MAG: hypothetical protein PUA74_03315 [Clostridiales bacterium]|nr:hypothetical protein [Clostridiales bacterium]